MVTFMGAVATLLYLLPLALTLAARSTRDRSLADIALEIPLLVALDLLGILVVARFVPLERSILVTRLGWTLAAAAVLGRRLRRGQVKWPVALNPRAIALVALSAIGSAGLSMLLSRVCHNADRAWHIPIVASLRGQIIPFANVYEPGGHLAYHFAGDVFAAVFQALSFDVIHASHALSLAHDLSFALTGASAALLLLWLGIDRAILVLAIVLSMLTAGPLTLLRGDHGRPDGGYNFINYYKLSFRPHVCLAGLLMVGFLGTMIVRLREARLGIETPPRRTVPVLLACTAALAITDEASVGVLGLALGLTWLLAPEVVHPRRLHGAAVFLGLLAAVVVPNVLFAATMAPGAPSHTMAWIPWRSPGYYHSSLPLTNPRGLAMLAFDLGPMVALLAGGLLVAVRRPTRERLFSLFFFAAALAVSTVALCRLDVDSLPIENHRFMTATIFLFPLCGAWWLARDGGEPRRLSSVSALGPFTIMSAIVLSSISTLEWTISSAPLRCIQPSNYQSKYEFFGLNCRDLAGARLGERAVPTYMATDIWYLHAGCNPVFAPGPNADHWKIKIGLGLFGEAAFREIHRDMVRPDEPLRIICPAASLKVSDAACNLAREHNRCRPLGRDTTECELSGSERVTVLARFAEDAAKKKASPSSPAATPPPTDSPPAEAELPGAN